MKIKSLKLHFWFWKWQFHAYGVSIFCKQTQEHALKRCQRWFYGCWCHKKCFGSVWNGNKCSCSITSDQVLRFLSHVLQQIVHVPPSHLLVSIILIFKRRCFILILIVMTWGLYRVCILQSFCVDNMINMIHANNVSAGHGVIFQYPSSNNIMPPGSRRLYRI